MNKVSAENKYLSTNCQTRIQRFEWRNQEHKIPKFDRKYLKSRLFTESENKGAYVEFCKGTRQSGLVSVWQHTLVSRSSSIAPAKLFR